MQRVWQVYVWHWKAGDDAIAWDDVGSTFRQQLNVGDVIQVANQDDDLFLVRIFDLEPCNVKGVYVEGI